MEFTEMEKRMLYQTKRRCKRSLRWMRGTVSVWKDVPLFLSAKMINHNIFPDILLA